MKSLKNQSKSLLIILFLFASAAAYNVSARNYYQLKIYNIKDKRQETVIDNYLKKAYIPAMHRAGIKNVGVFKPIKNNADYGKKIIVFIPFKKLTDIEKINTKLIKDTKYLTDGAEYLNASYNNPSYQRMESIVLKSFRNMPKFSIPNHATPKSERIYELRSYEGPTEKYYSRKVEMFNEGREIDIFKKLGFQAVFYGEVLSGNSMPNLMYMTTFSDMKSHDEHWKAFGNDPEWKVLSGLEKYAHTVSHSVIQLLYPTDYSDI